jgi:ring-1,2-phenylacetyl-CoA epoxidase subunit PaaD
MTIHQINKQTIYSYLEEINDPEVPVLSIIDLGIVRDVKMNDEELEVIITPTYTGLPCHGYDHCYYKNPISYTRF